MKNQTMNILVAGTYTERSAPAVTEDQELGKGIYLIPFHKGSGSVAGRPLIVHACNPSWVCMVKNRLFAVCEREDAAEIVECGIRSGETGLEVKEQARLRMSGKASCHIEADENRKRIFVSDYGSGDLKVIDISRPGKPKLLQEIYFEGKGLIPDRQEAPHIHSSLLCGNDLYAADLGCDKIYKFDASGDMLVQEESITAAPGSGPRHMRILRKGKRTYLYAVNELEVTISVYCDGKLRQTAALAENGQRGMLAADLCIIDERFLYVSVRGNGEILGFDINQDGMLKLKQKVMIPGGWFRSICADGSGGHLIAADQANGKIYIFSRGVDGMLTERRLLSEVPAPAKVLAAEIEY